MSRRAEFGIALGAALLALLIWLGLSQLPARHAVNIGDADAAYVQGFGEREQADAALAGADNARPFGPQAALLFPQAGAPATLTLRWRTTGGQPVKAIVRLNGATPLGEAAIEPSWGESQFAIPGGQSKPSGDWFVTVDLPDPAAIYLDRATYAVPAGPTLTSGYPPAPLPLAAAGLAAGLLAPLLPRSRRGRMIPGWRRSLAAAAAVTALLALLYRWQPPLIPYPIRRLPLLLVGGLIAAHAVRWGPAIIRARPRWLEAALVGGGLLAWGAFLWRAQAQHLVLSLPGVEADFSVFAKRSASWGEVLRADGFYNLGYPLLLRLARPLVHDSPFLAARLLSVGSALIVAAATWRLGRARWGRGAGLVALLLITLNPLVTHYALAVGTDMPFAAACALAVALALRSPSLGRRDALLAGLAAGAAFSIRHPGILLLPWIGAVAGVRWVARRRARGGAGQPEIGASRSIAALLALLALGFVLGAGPQIAVNLADTGQPLYSQQAKNIWLAVYGNTEFSRWDEERNDISLFSVIRRDPARFAANWWDNLVAFSGTGGARAAEFERAVQLRLLAWPFNLLALAGLALWTLRPRAHPAAGAPGAALVGWLALYLLGVSVGFLLPRFALPLAQIYALAAATACSYAIQKLAARCSQTYDLRPLAALLAAALIAGQAAAGAQNLLDQQIPSERALAAAIIASVPDGAPIGASLEPRTALAKYSAVAHRLTILAGASPASGSPASGSPASAAPGAPAADLAWLVAEGDPPAGWQPVARAGNLGLYRR